MRTQIIRDEDGASRPGARSPSRLGGSPQLSSAGTAEIAALLDRWGLLRPPPDILDIGCGIGRLEAALAPAAASIVGLDVAPAMLEGIGAESIDLVALIDTFPYLLLSANGLACRCLLDSRRVLRTGGSVVIFNVSHHGDADADLADVAALAEVAGLHFQRAEWRPLRSWDAPAFQLVKR